MVRSTIRPGLAPDRPVPVTRVPREAGRPQDGEQLRTGCAHQRAQAHFGVLDAHWEYCDVTEKQGGAADLNLGQELDRHALHHDVPLEQGASLQAGRIRGNGRACGVRLVSSATMVGATRSGLSAARRNTSSSRSAKASFSDGNRCP